MRILIVKTSSLGDVVHMLPALTDAVRRVPGLRADWVVEEGFSAVPQWHPAVERVLPVAIRRWRRNLTSRTTWTQMAVFRDQLRETPYDAIVDSQGLLKSAWIAWSSRGPCWGFDRRSVREPLASLAYDHRVHVSTREHAVERNRQLLAHALGYSLEGLALDYGVQAFLSSPLAPRDVPDYPCHVMALHGTSRIDKEWPQASWVYLGNFLAKHGSGLLLPWGNAREHERAQTIASEAPASVVLPRLDLDRLAVLIGGAPAVVGMDTGLMHVAAAFARPGIALFPTTAPELTGVRPAAGSPQILNLSTSLDMAPERVGTHLLHLLRSEAGSI